MSIYLEVKAIIAKYENVNTAIKGNHKTQEIREYNGNVDNFNKYYMVSNVSPLPTTERIHFRKNS